MKMLWVGDPHARVEDLDECRRLVRWVKEKAQESGAEFIVVSGDLFHTHAVVRLEVLHFWREAVADWLETHNVILLVGNHDMPGDGEAATGVHALAALEGLDHTEYGGVLWVIDSATVVFDILFVPYMHERNAFIDVCRQHPTKTVFCHQSFNGAAYENGVYAQDGVDPEAIPQSKVISGHFHSNQAFGKVWYPGSPRWLTAGDANVEKAVHYMRFQDGEAGDLTRYDTSEVCTPVVKFEWTPEKATWGDPPAIGASIKTIVDVRGPADFVEHWAPLFSGAGCRVRTFVDSKRVGMVRESEGVHVAFGKFLSGFRGKFGTPTEALAEMVKHRLPTLMG